MKTKTTHGTPPTTPPPVPIYPIDPPTPPKVFPIFNSRIKMGKRKFDKLHEHSNYLWAEEAKKHKMVTEILTEMPNHLIKASMEYALEPIALEMKFDE